VAYNHPERGQETFNVRLTDVEGVTAQHLHALMSIPIPTRLPFSSKKHLPLVRIGAHDYYLHQYFLSVLGMRRFHITCKQANYIVSTDGYVVEMSPDLFGIFFCEWRIWSKTYLPSISLEGKTVLDAGAGCGETALFYLLQGAKKVLCVENSPSAVELLAKNARKNNWNVEIIPESFSLSHLSLGFDFAKIDVEGAEACLLSLSSIDFPCVVETHSKDVRDKLCAKFGFKPLKRQGGLTTICNSKWLLPRNPRRYRTRKCSWHKRITM
jgi:SAM-dependent methyltransferase